MLTQRGLQVFGHRDEVHLLHVHNADAFGEVGFAGDDRHDVRGAPVDVVRDRSIGVPLHVVGAELGVDRVHGRVLVATAHLVEDSVASGARRTRVDEDQADERLIRGGHAGDAREPVVASVLANEPHVVAGRLLDVALPQPAVHPTILVGSPGVGLAEGQGRRLHTIDPRGDLGVGHVDHHLPALRVGHCHATGDVAVEADRGLDERVHVVRLARLVDLDVPLQAAVARHLGVDLAVEVVAEVGTGRVDHGEELTRGRVLRHEQRLLLRIVCRDLDVARDRVSRLPLPEATVVEGEDPPLAPVDLLDGRRRVVDLELGAENVTTHRLPEHLVGLRARGLPRHQPDMIRVDDRHVFGEDTLLHRDELLVVARVEHGPGRDSREDHECHEADAHDRTEPNEPREHSLLLTRAIIPEEAPTNRTHQRTDADGGERVAEPRAHPEGHGGHRDVHQEREPEEGEDASRDRHPELAPEVLREERHEDAGARGAQHRQERHGELLFSGF